MKDSILHLTVGEVEMLQTLDQPSVPTRAAVAPSRPNFPLPIRLNNRKYFRASALAQFKAELEFFALGVDLPPPQPVENDCLLPTKVVAAQFGVTLRTLDRWLANSRAAVA